MEIKMDDCDTRTMGSGPIENKDPRIRTIVNAHHTRDQLSFALGAFERIGKKLDII